jgi:hypothetical protein
MKTILTVVGIVAGCLLSGCAHDTKSGTASRPAVITAAYTVTNIYTFPVSSTGPLSYQWYTLPATNQTVTNTGTVTLQASGTNATPYYTLEGTLPATNK